MSRSLRELLDHPPGDGQRITVEPDSLDPEAIALVPRDLAERYRAVGLAFDDRRLLLGMENPGDMRAIDDIAFRTSKRVMPVGLDGDVAALIKAAHSIRVPSEGDEPPTLDRMLDALVDDDDLPRAIHDEKHVVDLERAHEDAPIAKLANLVLVDAIKQGATDILIERHPLKGRVKIRRRGRWQVTMNPPAQLCRPLLERLKRMADIDERGPATGVIHLQVGRGKEQRFRLVTRPDAFGEVAALRLIFPIALKNLFDEAQLERLGQWTADGGLVVAASTAGQGATTTAHAVSDWMTRRQRAVVYFDRVPELLTDGASHGWLDPHGHSLSAALAQAADVIVIGEPAPTEQVLTALRGGALVWLVTSAVSADRARADLDPMLLPYLKGVLHQTLVHETCAACEGRDASCSTCGGVGATSTSARFTFLDADLPGP